MDTPEGLPVGLVSMQGMERLKSTRAAAARLATRAPMMESSLMFTNKDPLCKECGCIADSYDSKKGEKLSSILAKLSNAKSFVHLCKRHSDPLYHQSGLRRHLIKDAELSLFTSSLRARLLSSHESKAASEKRKNPNIRGFARIYEYTGGLEENGRVVPLNYGMAFEKYTTSGQDHGFVGGLYKGEMPCFFARTERDRDHPRFYGMDLTCFHPDNLLVPVEQQNPTPLSSLFVLAPVANRDALAYGDPTCTTLGVYRANPALGRYATRMLFAHFAYLALSAHETFRALQAGILEGKRYALAFDYPHMHEKDWESGKGGPGLILPEYEPTYHPDQLVYGTPFLGVPHVLCAMLNSPSVGANEAEMPWWSALQSIV